MATWTITWLGHSGFRIEAGGKTLLVDPWLRGSPSFDESRFDEATRGATHLLLSHGHFDHAANAKEIVEKTGAVPVGMFELMQALEFGDDAVGFNKGGQVDLDGVRVTLVHAVHSSSVAIDGRPVYAGGECGFMIETGGETLYFMGDTDVFADMGLYQELHKPRVGVVPIGGRFTMDAERAAFACKKFFQFDVVVPCHYQTFPLLAQSADGFAAAMAPTRVVAPSVMETVAI